MTNPEKEKALRRTGLSPKFLLRSSPTAEATGSATTTSSICSEDVKCNRHDYRKGRPSSRLGTCAQATIRPACPFYSPRGADAYQGQGVLDAYQVGSAPVLASYIRCSAPLDILKYTRRRAKRPRAFLLRLEKLRVSRCALARALTSCAETRSRLFSKLAVPKEHSTSSTSSSSSSGRSRALVTEASSHSFSRGNGGLL